MASQILIAGPEGQQKFADLEMSPQLTRYAIITITSDPISKAINFYTIPFQSILELYWRCSDNDKTKSSKYLPDKLKFPVKFIIDFSKPLLNGLIMRSIYSPGEKIMFSMKVQKYGKRDMLQ